MSLLIVYNASGTLLGHLAYGYHHIRSTPDKECSACALTHGPSLSLSERDEWASLKERLERGSLKGLEGKKVLVKQLHTEDISQEVRSSSFVSWYPSMR